MADRASVILINGAPSAGKTTLGTAVQRALPEPFLQTAVDDFLSMHPDRSRCGVLIREPASAGVRIELTLEGSRLMDGFHRAVAALARTGIPVIVDDVLFDPTLERGWLEAFSTVIPDSRVLLVGVHCTLAECERREQARGDRTLGIARGAFDRVHANRLYDVEVDTTHVSPEDCAVHVLDRWRKGPGEAAAARRRAIGIP